MEIIYKVINNCTSRLTDTGELQSGRRVWLPPVYIYSMITPTTASYMGFTVPPVPARPNFLEGYSYQEGYQDNGNPYLVSGNSYELTTGNLPSGNFPAALITTHLFAPGLASDTAYLQIASPADPNVVQQSYTMTWTYKLDFSASVVHYAWTLESPTAPPGEPEVKLIPEPAIHAI